MAVLAEDQCFSVASGHHLLPQRFAFSDILQLPDVMHLKGALFGFAVLALSSVPPFDNFRAAERPDVGVGLLIDRWAIGPGCFKILQPEEFNDTRFLFSWNDKCIAILGFQPFGNLVETRLVFVGKRFQQACLPHVGEFVHPRLGTFRQGIVVGQASQFPIVGKNDFRVTASRPFLLVDRLGGLVVAISFVPTEPLEFVLWNMQLDTLRDRFHRRVAVAPFHFHGSIC